MSALRTHTVFVLSLDENPLTPTTPAKARKLIRGGVAKQVWSKFGTFGIQMLVSTRRETPRVAL
ncbi:MAG: RRXRR domain-containing protein, partial [Isosphaeraceae bacterium]